MLDLKGIVDSFVSITGLVTRRIAILTLIAIYVTWIDPSIFTRFEGFIADLFTKYAVVPFIFPTFLDAYIGAENRQNAIFILVVILIIGTTIYYTYLAVIAVGKFIPLNMIYNPSDAVRRTYSLVQIIIYSKDEFDLNHTTEIIMEKEESEKLPIYSGKHWWNEAFIICKSLLAITILLLMLDLRNVHISLVFLSLLLILATMVFLSIIESARYQNDLEIRINNYSLELKSKNQPKMSVEEAWELLRKIQYEQTPRWRLRPVHLGISISYFGSPSEISRRIRQSVSSVLARIRELFQRWLKRISQNR